MSDTILELRSPELLPARSADPAVTEAIGQEIPGIIDWLGGIDGVDVEGVAPYDVTAAMASGFRSPEAPQMPEAPENYSG